jgi:hypothetical protein
VPLLDRRYTIVVRRVERVCEVPSASGAEQRLDGRCIQGREQRGDLCRRQQQLADEALEIADERR